jgi:lipopolysaccharide transport system ATP-binding protein
VAKIVAEDIYVEFPIYGVTNRSLKNAVLRAATGGLIARDSAERVVVQALSGLSFELKEGDRMGVVGHNGSGKTTLLRALSGSYEPARGRLRVEGRVASMLNVWLGMEQEATGLENIMMRGVIMGLRPAEIDRLTDEICEFAELGDYIHMPLRTYSSGMAMRLAFSISTSVSADILIMDEWLSAGDASFTEKAQSRMSAIVSKAKILVLASHDDKLIRKNCNRLMHLNHGQMVRLEALPASEPAAD